MPRSKVSIQAGRRPGSSHHVCRVVRDVASLAPLKPRPGAARRPSPVARRPVLLLRALDLPADGAGHRRPGLGLVPLPLVGGLALCRPGVDGGDLLLEGGVDEAVALEGAEALELGGDDERRKGLAAAACGRGGSVSAMSTGGQPGAGRGPSVPDMSVTSTWTAPRRSAMVARRPASVIWAIVGEGRGGGDSRRDVRVLACGLVVADDAMGLDGSWGSYSVFGDS